MPFHRFENFESNFLTPHLSSGKAPVIEGSYMYFCLLHKSADTGSELHYHPNELLIFPVRGKINAIVGKDRRIVPAGTFVHAPAYARHSMKATEDGDCQYLYIKAGDIIHVPRGEPYRLQVRSPFARYVMVRSTSYLEHRIESMTPEEAEQARVNVKAN